MKKPDTLIAKYYFLILIAFLIIFIFSILMWILGLSGKCSSGATLKELKKEKKNKNTIIYLIISVLVCSMAAQAVNQSYTRIVK
jgi:cytosine/uracil/thiamine/allantoin permease